MSAPKKAGARVIREHTVTYTDRDGETQERAFRTSGPNGAMKLHPGGSAFLGMLTLVLGILTPFGESVIVLTGLVARIRVDGSLVVEPTHRGEEWFTPEGESRPGPMIFDFVGDESRIALGELACKGIPALAKRAKSARAALAKRAS